MDNKLELVVTIVNRGFADEVMDAAKEAGASGGTVLYARGTGIHEAEQFFGVTIQPEKEVVLILTSRESKNAIMKSICKGAGLTTMGRGMSFSLPVDEALGIVHMQQEIENGDPQKESGENPPKDGGCNPVDAGGAK